MTFTEARPWSPVFTMSELLAKINLPKQLTLPIEVSRVSLDLNLSYQNQEVVRIKMLDIKAQLKDDRTVIKIDLDAVRTDITPEQRSSFQKHFNQQKAV